MLRNIWCKTESYTRDPFILNLLNFLKASLIISYEMVTRVRSSIFIILYYIYCLFMYVASIHCVYIVDVL